MGPNNSFKPNLLRYTNNVAGKACHVVGYATQVGLTQALGAMPIIIEESDAKLIRRIKSVALWSWVATLFFGAVSWTARVYGHSFVSNLAFAAIWLGVATFIACVLLLMLAAIILAFTRGRHNDGA